MLRKAIASYAKRLEDQAKHHARFASVLRAVSHRLLHILADNPPAPSHTEIGYMGADGKIHPLETFGDQPVDETAPRMYKRKVTEWKEIQ